MVVGTSAKAPRLGVTDGLVRIGILTDLFIAYPLLGVGKGRLVMYHPPIYRF